ncbi:MAG TPA: hypothetical protein VL651_07440 [Bacteroidia bacterium]|jgi:hypothetical protein|nr:hypothetical protein [Bacteroidia bacterium]
MNKISIGIFVAGALSFSIHTNAQVLTHEDSLAAGLVASEKATLLSGYGEVACTYDVRNNTANADVARAVLFVGHKFSNKIALFSELEIEDGKVDAGGGEAAFEQLFLKFDLCRNAYISAGLFVPRLGITNENHLPTTFNGVDRTYVETWIIPATWREIGVALYGKCDRLSGLNYSFGLVNGLSSANFEYGTGIREGRWEGRNATASNIAVTGSALYYFNKFRAQISAYYGGSAGVSRTEADSLHLSNGAFGTPVALTEADLQYNNNGFSFRTLATVVNIKDAAKINAAYGNNTPEMMFGAYAEAGYNILRFWNSETNKDLTLFGRYEYLDMNYRVPENGMMNNALAQSYVVTGITFLPLHGVVVKADYMIRTTGKPNPNLPPVSPSVPFYASNGFFQLGIGYSF